MTADDMRFRQVITAGTWCVDNNKLLPNWPQEGTSTAILEARRAGGGSACNFAIDFRRLDPTLPVATIGRLGDDENGRFLQKLAQEYHINTDRLRLAAGEATSVTDAFTNDSSGNRTHLFEVGSNANLTPDDFDLAGGEDGFLHLGLAGAHPAMDSANGGDATGWVTVLKRAKRAGMITNIEVMSIDPAEVARLNRPSLPHLDMLIVNDWEIGALADEATIDLQGADIDACRRAAEKVLDAGAMRLVVVHTPGHALCLTRDRTLHEKRAVRVPPEAIVGANGAGDAFAAGFVCGLTRGVDIGDCLSYGHAAAAASLRDATTTGSVDDILGCLALADRWGWS